MQNAQKLPVPAPRTVVVLGGGVTGLTAAAELKKQTGGRVLVVERADSVGGLAQSFQEKGQILDFGSHRIHEQYDPEVFGIIKGMLGDELLKMPRRGQIRIQDRFVNYPPSVLQILGAFGFSTGVRFALGYAWAAVRRIVLRPKAKNFEEYSQLAVGDALYRKFYLPYAQKLWNTPPTELSIEPAVNRMKKFELMQLWREVKKRFSLAEAEYYFYYPKKGFGQIAERLGELYADAGGEVRTSSTVERFELKEAAGAHVIAAVHVKDAAGKVERIPVDEVVSTIPIDALDRMLDFPDDKVEGRSLGLKWRSLRLVYLITEDKIPSVNETYYFPEPNVLFGRVSEIGMYSPYLKPAGGKTALSIEIPCSEGDKLWAMDDTALADLCLAELRRLGLCKPGKSAAEIPHLTRKVRNLYPVHTIGWRDNLKKAFTRFQRVKNLYPIGRPALFLHCNVDHCMVMALRLGRHLAVPAATRRREQWDESMQEFFDFRIRD